MKNFVEKVDNFVSKSLQNKYDKYIIILSIFIIGIMCGIYFNAIGNIDSMVAKEKIDIMLSNYYKDVELDDEKINNLYIEAVARSLGDDYTFYSYGDEAKEISENLSGRICGIGITASAHSSGGLEVLDVFTESPAEKAGLQKGDVIVNVDGDSILTLTQDQSIGKIKGEENTYVSIIVLRGTEEKHFDIKRESIEIPDVTSQMYGDYGYIRISSFSENADEQFHREIKKMKTAKGLVIDLRYNGGGLLETVKAIADDLMDDDILITVEYKDKEDEIIRLTDGKEIDVPIILLVNQYTASASEVLAGSLRDNLDSEIVGTTTYGKGIICTYIEYKDGTAMSVSNGEYVLPYGKHINKVGIKPDYEYPEQYEEGWEIEDMQLSFAITQLKLNERQVR